MSKLLEAVWSEQQDSNLHQPIDFAQCDSDGRARVPGAARSTPGCDSDIRGTLIKPAIVIVLLAALLSAAVVTAHPCKPGDRGTTIGHAMLIEGCPR